MASEASCSHHLPITMQSKGENNSEKYDVFLSHRGPDTKTGFVGFLYKDLEKHGLKPYLDRECIRPGEECWESIEDAIKNTPIAVVVFSERYAESEWCLKELHVMLEAQSCKMILPIFYNVTPWDLRNPERGQFKDGFEKLKKKFNSNLIEQWQANLEVASKLMGWESSDKTTSFQVELVAKVVERILELANKPLPLDVGEHVVGVKEVADELIQCQVFEKEVFALGLWGMGGIGKSTLAKELYNQLCRGFEASCYIEDVTDKIMQGHGVVDIQKRLLEDLCSFTSKNCNKSELKPILEERLSKKKIVVVLDDVSNVEMLNYIMTCKMLKNGSICIVTSRDKRVFEASNIFEGTKQEVYVHEVKMLNMVDSKRVFTSFAFGRDCEMRLNYEYWATKISKQCCGVPLVLKVCGALLKGEVNLDVWKGVEKKLTCNGMLDDKNILNCLRISYDSLREEEKKMFLDIACALLGESEDMGISIWRSQQWEPSLGVRNLKKKALISVDEQGYFTMHDHLRDMGREIEQVQAGDTRRLWMPKSLSLLKDKKPLPHSLQTLVITYSDLHIDLDLSKMEQLRILICDNTVNLISIPQNLRCLHDPKDYLWFENPLRHNFPKVSKKNKLAILKWSGINPTYGFWKSFERLTKLKTLKLEFKEEKGILDIFWRRGECVANFDKLCMLQDISLRDFNGKTISGFSSKHCNLRYLNLNCCQSLRSCLGVGNLLALEELSFDNCPKLEELPNLLNLARLQSVRIGGCGFKDVSCLGSLISLRSLSIWSCYSLETLPDLHKLTRLEELKVINSPNNVGLAGVNISQSSNIFWVDQPTTGTRMALQTLKLDHVGCKELPDLSLFPELKRLNINYCRRLERLISTLPMTALEELDIYDCPELQEVPDLTQCTHLRRLNLNFCRSLQSCPGVGDLLALEELSFFHCPKLEELPNLLNLARLQSVHIDGCGFKDLSCLGNLISLRSLSISWCNSLETLPDLHKFTRLEELKVSGCPKIVGWAGVSVSKSSGTFWVDQPTTGTGMALQTLRFWGVGCRELPDLSLFPALKRLIIVDCRRLERLMSTMPMTALDWLEIWNCPELQVVPDLNQCRLLRHCRILDCEKISLTTDEITKLEAMCPGLKVDFRP